MQSSMIFAKPVSDQQANRFDAILIGSKR